MVKVVRLVTIQTIKMELITIISHLFDVLESILEGTYYSPQLLLELKAATIKTNYFKKI